jgi:hypothetical protein
LKYKNGQIRPEKLKKLSQMYKNVVLLSSKCTQVVALTKISSKFQVKYLGLEKYVSCRKRANIHDDNEYKVKENQV